MNAHDLFAGIDLRQTGYLFTLLIASVLFLLGLRGLSHSETARRGLNLAALGMLLAVVGTLLSKRIVTYEWIVGGLVVGTVIGVPMGRWIPMTKMPERIALSHAFGGLAVALVGVAEYFNHNMQLSPFDIGAIGFEVLLGTITFTGSLMAFGKLMGILPGRPQTFPGQNAINLALLAVALDAGGHSGGKTRSAGIVQHTPCDWAASGRFLVVRIGGADMPVVICLLNSYAGLAAAATGFALNVPVLIVCGALDGGSGFILAVRMSKAMNRSFRNVIFGAFGAKVHQKIDGERAAGMVREGTPEDAAELLKLAEFGHRGSGLRDGRGASAACGARSGGVARKNRGRRKICNPSRCGTDARTYERSSCRGECALRSALRARFDQ